MTILTCYENCHNMRQSNCNHLRPKPVGNIANLSSTSLPLQRSVISSVARRSEFAHVIDCRPLNLLPPQSTIA